MSDQLQLLNSLSFGQTIAEQESHELARYFVSTFDWEQVIRGEKDVILGAKGSGKSAIYVALLARKEEMAAERGILLAAAENVSGSVVFKENLDNLPRSEDEFRFLWKLYFFLITVRRLQEQLHGNKVIDELVRTLQKAQILPPDTGRLSGILKSVTGYVKRIINPKEIKVGTQDGPEITITFSEPDPADVERGHISIEALFDRVNRILLEERLTVWIALDRLDVAFVENQEIEEVALRALFRTYLDLLGFQAIRTKLFLRTDIWRQVTRKGFREASHVMARSVEIRWNEHSLFHLAISRLISNDEFVRLMEIDRHEVLGSFELQVDTFYRVFPGNIERGSTNRNAFGWIVRRIQDGTGNATPRELIEVLRVSRDNQVRDIKMGRLGKHEGVLISPAAVRDAWETVSRGFLQAQLYAEYADCREWLERLRGKGIIWPRAALLKVWQVDEVECERRAARLREIGFWTHKNGGSDEHQIAYLFRPALGLIQRREE